MLVDINIEVAGLSFEATVSVTVSIGKNGFILLNSESLSCDPQYAARRKMHKHSLYAQNSLLFFQLPLWHAVTRPGPLRHYWPIRMRCGSKRVEATHQIPM